MIDYMREFIIILLTAAVFQNAIFTRGLGLTKATSETYSLRAAFLFGGTLTLVATFAALASWPLNSLIRQYGLSARLGIRYIMSATALICVSIMLVVLFFASRKWTPRYHYNMRPIFPQIVMNCAILGTISLSITSGYNLWQTVTFALGSGLGYTVALMLLCEGRRRIHLSDIPRSFRGFPITLLYMGIVSMAIYGLIGHQIPT